MNAFILNLNEDVVPSPRMIYGKPDVLSLEILCEADGRLSVEVKQTFP